MHHISYPIKTNCPDYYHNVKNQFQPVIPYIKTHHFVHCHILCIHRIVQAILITSVKNTHIIIYDIPHSSQLHNLIMCHSKSLNISKPTTEITIISINLLNIDCLRLRWNIHIHICIMYINMYMFIHSKENKKHNRPTWETIRIVHFK